MGLETPGEACTGYMYWDSSSYCNTQAYIQKMNAEGFRGSKIWRLPSMTELLSIVNADRPVRGEKYFPYSLIYSEYGRVNSYWSSTLFEENRSSAAVDLGWGLTDIQLTGNMKHVILVHD